MLEGITILNQEMIMVSPSWVGPLFFILLVGGAVSFGLFLASNNISIMPIAAILTLVSLFGIIILGVIEPKVESGRYRYEVIIDESVAFTDIYENYHVIEQRGDIWVLEEKK